MLMGALSVCCCCSSTRTPSHISRFLYSLRRLPTTSFSSHSLLRLCPSPSSAAPSPPPLLARSFVARHNMVRVLDSVRLTDLEKRIFDTLKGALVHFNLHTHLRVAGGWVRDKLLGKDCYDIDIAIDNMLGREFCEKVNQYLQSIGEEARGVGIIRSNPEQSKHLETARIQMFGVWIDFVNLRAETYADHSRIPTMEFGTAEQDAYRRDLTINSLFYNINTNTVEDLTGRGISDLKAGIISTPLPPKQTFLDDPLRVLRAVRFGARFEYALEDDLKKAASDDDVKHALASKVSRERIGHEIDLMIIGSHPVKAIWQLADLHLFWIIFSLPSDLETTALEETERLCKDNLEVVWELMNYLNALKLTGEQRRICLMGALLLPLIAFQYHDHKKKLIPVSTFIIRESLKMKANDADRVVALHKSAKEFSNLTPVLLSKDEGLQNIKSGIDCREEWEDSEYSKKAVQAGLVLMEIKELWRAAVLLSLVISHPVVSTHDLSDDDKHLNLKERSKQFLTIEEVILGLGLEKVWERKPLLDGNSIMAELGLTSGGPLVKEWQKRLLKWQLSHLSGTAEDCLEWFRKNRVKKLRLN
eukprot:c28308_g1_i1 orf=785-2548(-)